MKKSLLKTVGSFQAICPQSGQMVPFNRPAVVTSTSFFQECVFTGRMEVVIGDLPDFITDADFLDAWKEAEGDEEDAVEAFMLTVAALSSPSEEEILAAERAEAERKAAEEKAEAERKVAEETEEAERQAEEEAQQQQPKKPSPFVKGGKKNAG